MNNTSYQDNVKLWTRQHKYVIDELNREGTYRVKKKYLIQKFDTIFDYYTGIYKWYADRAEKIVPRPEGVEYPIWLSTSSEMMLQPTEDNVIIEIVVDRKEAVFTDAEKWGYISNYWYLPIDKEDEGKFNEELRRNGIGDESELYMGHKGNFYPHLRSKIINSWERLFEGNWEITQTTQATLWELRKEWVINVVGY